MATFVYEAMNQTGQEVKDEIEALTTEDALAKIRNLGYFPTRIREKGGAKAKAQASRGKSGKFKTGRVGTKPLTQFTRQLATLQDAGLPILRSLTILQEQQKPGGLKNVLRTVTEDIEAGSTLSEAFGKHPRAFDRLYVNMVHAGEVGGVLDMILRNLADFMEKSQKLKRKITGAMIYPSVVLVFATTLFPVAIANGAPWWFALGAFGVWFVGFSLGTVSVHAIKVRHKGVSRGRWTIYGAPALAGFVILTAFVTMVAARLPTMIPAAVLPGAAVALVASGGRIHPRHLRRVGWSLVGAHVVTLGLLLSV